MNQPESEKDKRTRWIIGWILMAASGCAINALSALWVVPLWKVFAFSLLFIIGSAGTKCIWPDRK